MKTRREIHAAAVTHVYIVQLQYSDSEMSIFDSVKEYTKDCANRLPCITCTLASHVINRRNFRPDVRLSMGMGSRGSSLGLVLGLVGLRLGFGLVLYAAHSGTAMQKC